MGLKRHTIGWHENLRAGDFGEPKFLATDYADFVLGNVFNLEYSRNVMHEHSFIEAILRNVENRENVKGIVLEVGELVGIDPRHLKEHILERFDWDVEVIGREGKVRCECGFEGRAKVLERLHDLVVFECPECGGIPRVLEGDAIVIVKVIYN